jgi:hypothetical protein
MTNLPETLATPQRMPWLASVARWRSAGRALMGRTWFELVIIVVGTWLTVVPLLTFDFPLMPARTVGALLPAVRTAAHRRTGGDVHGYGTQRACLFRIAIMQCSRNDRVMLCLVCCFTVRKKCDEGRECGRVDTPSRTGWKCG